MESSDEEFFDAKNEFSDSNNAMKRGDFTKDDTQDSEYWSQDWSEINESSNSIDENNIDLIQFEKLNVIQTSEEYDKLHDVNYETSESESDGILSEEPVKNNEVTEAKVELDPKEDSDFQKIDESNTPKEPFTETKAESDHENDSDFRKVDEPNSVVTPDEEYELKRRQEMENQLSQEELNELLQKSQNIKLEGNSHFKNDEYFEAIDRYTAAIDTCPLIYETERSAYFYNRAVCLSKIDKNEEAIKDCSDAINLKQDYLKAFIKRAELYEKTEKLTEALEDYKAVNNLDPKNWNALYAIQTLPQRIHEQQEKMKEDMLKQLKQLGNMVLKPFGLSTENFQMVQDPNTGGYSVNFQK